MEVSIQLHTLVTLQLIHMIMGLTQNDEKDQTRLCKMLV
jgi:hypothetical protein